MGLSPAGLRELFLFSFLWTRYSCSAPKSASIWLQTIFYLAFLISHYFSLKWSKRQLPNPYLCSPCDTADGLVPEYHLPASWGFLISISPCLNWSAMPNLLPAWLIGWPMSSTYLFPWLLLSWACTSVLGHLQPPWLVPWSVFVLSCFLRYLFGLLPYSWFNFANIAYSSNFLKILLLGPHWFPGNLCTSVVFVFGME